MDEDRKAMQHIEYCNQVRSVSHAQYGIPSRCPCGENIVEERCEKEVYDLLLGKRFFTCRQFKDDGLHFRQPWVVGVEEELQKLTRRVEEDERRVWPVEDLILQIKKLQVKEDVEKLTMRVNDLEMVL